MKHLPLTITFLGTGTSTGIPMIACTCAVCTSLDTKNNRLRSSIMVQSATTTIVVDTTPDFRYQMLRTKTKHIDAIIFTHPHKDHIAGLDDVKAFNYFNHHTMPLYANAITEEALRRDYYYAFSQNKYPGVPDLKIYPINDTTFMIGDIAVTPIQVHHATMPVLAFRFGNFTYVTDANKIDVSEKQKIKGSKIMVLNALRKEPHTSHFSLQEAINLVNELQIPKVYFTHISHQLGLHHLVSNELPRHIELAFDGLTIHL